MTIYNQLRLRKYTTPNGERRVYVNGTNRDHSKIYFRCDEGGRWDLTSNNFRVLNRFGKMSGSYKHRDKDTVVFAEIREYLRQELLWTIAE